MPRTVRRLNFGGKTLTVSEIAERTGLSRQTIYGLVSRRGVDVFKSGKVSVRPRKVKRFTAEEAAALRRQWAQPELAQ